MCCLVKWGWYELCNSTLVIQHARILISEGCKEGDQSMMFLKVGQCKII